MGKKSEDQKRKLASSVTENSMDKKARKIVLKGTDEGTITENSGDKMARKNQKKKLKGTGEETSKDMEGDDSVAMKGAKNKKPLVSMEKWTDEDDKILIQAYEEFKTDWATILSTAKYSQLHKWSNEQLRGRTNTLGNKGRLGALPHALKAVKDMAKEPQYFVDAAATQIQLLTEIKGKLEEIITLLLKKNYKGGNVDEPMLQENNAEPKETLQENAGPEAQPPTN